MSSSFPDSFDQFDGDSPAAGETHSFDDGYHGPDSFSNFDSTAADSPPPIYASGGELHSDAEVFASETNSNGPILPPPAEMEPEEGAALREWRRQNAIRIEEKEKREKELLIQIIVEAEEYKAEFHRKREIACETNKATNREKEKIFVASQEKFHAEADKDYWKSIAELIPKEVPTIEKRKGKKEQEKKPSIVVVQGPKPGKPTDLARMRQILLKLKHKTPPHLKFSPAPPQHAAKPDASAAPKAPAVAVA
ncbi:Vesicle coat protein clathrin, light chain [Handroanthus impetiginosus]|uniref:Clathrin light chain n=1 Tax=Handroanthus impetiginosus TaxID=429701 RepID=A0A2G9G9Y1_9LAMI|nr:Vesicle coat protein clathrin, light chain [Handroanthus impetiginosus]